MKKIILRSVAVLAITAGAAFNVNMNTQDSNLSALAVANIEALAGYEYHLGQPGTNWKTYTISCTVAQQNSTGSSWYWDANAQVYVYGIPIGAGVGGSGSGSSEVNYAPMTYDKDVCGAGAGICLSSAPSGHPCA